MEPDDPAASTEVLLSERIGHVVVLTLNRPRARNALNPELKDAILQAMAEADGDPGVRAVVITGNGPVFCAGMDLKAFAGGAALGGGFEIALACDLVIASEDAWLAMPEVKRGLFAAGGGTTVATRIPLAVALEMGLTGDPVTAARAEQLGLVNKVVPADEVRKEAVTMAEKLAANGPLAVALTKKLIRERRWADADETAAIFRSADAMEGARAFAERRPPAWTGK